MKKNIFVVLFLAFLSLQAQKKRIHTIKLLPNKTESVLEADFYISEIIDNRILKSNIGIAQKGLFNKKVLSDFSKPFDQELLDYLKTILPSDSTKTALSLRINQLLISEHTGAFKETGKAIVRLDVLIKDSANEYSSLGYFEANKQKNSMDVTPKHDDRIRAVLKDCMLQFASLDRKTITPYKINLYAPSETIILKDSIKSGFYGTYTELANNNPIKTIKFEIQKRSTSKKLHLKDLKTKKKVTHFAYNDGKQTFLNASTYSGERHYVKTERFDQFLIFNDVFVNQDNVIGLSMAFGVLGVLASNERQTVMFDLNTGQFYSLNRIKMQLMLKKDYPDLYKKYRKKQKTYKNLKEILNTVYKETSPEEFRAIIRR